MINFHRYMICFMASVFVMASKPAFAQLPDLVHGGQIQLPSNSCSYLVAPAVQNNLQALYRAFNNPYTARLSSGADEEIFSYVINWQRSGGSTKRLNGSVRWKKNNPTEISWRMWHDNLEVFGVPLAATVELEAQFRKHFALLDNDAKRGLFDCSKAPSPTQSKPSSSSGGVTSLDDQEPIDWKDLDACVIQGAFRTGDFGAMMNGIVSSLSTRIPSGNFSADSFKLPNKSDNKYDEILSIDVKEGRDRVGTLKSFVRIGKTSINVRLGGYAVDPSRRELMTSIQSWLATIYGEGIERALNPHPTCKDAKLPFEPLRIKATPSLDVEGPKAEIQAIKFSADSNNVLTLRKLSGDNASAIRIDLLDLSKSKLTENIARSVTNPMDVDLSPDGRLIAIAASPVSVIWDIAANKALHTFKRGCRKTQFSPDGKLVVFASEQSGGSCADIVIFNVASGQLSKSLKMEGGKAFTAGSIAFDRSGTRLFSIGREQKLSTWDVATGSLKTSANVMGALFALSADANAAQVFSAPGDSQSVWNTTSGAKVGSVKQDGKIERAAFSLDGKVLATGNADGQVILWDAKNYRSILGFMISESDTPAQVVAISPNGKLLATGDRLGQIKFWDLPAMLDANYVEGERDIHESSQRLKGVSTFVTNAVREAQKKNNRKPVSVQLEILPSRLEAKEGKPIRNVALHFDAAEKALKVSAPGAQIIKFKIEADGTIRRLGD